MLGTVHTRAPAPARPEKTPARPASVVDVAAPEHVLALQRTVGNRRVTGLLQRQPKPAAREDVVVIVGRASHTTEGKESAEDKELMTGWRATAKNLAPGARVFEGLTVDQAFKGVGKLTTPIGRLYIIGHGDPSGIEEVDAKTGNTRGATMEDLTKRMRAALGDLKDRAPQSVEILYCSAGGSPKALAQIAVATGAPIIRAPIQETVIGQITFSNQDGKRLTVADFKGESDDTLKTWIRKTEAVKRYDFVPGVPHDKPLSQDEKLTALIGVLRKTGSIPQVSFNEPAGGRKAVPIWQAEVTKRSSDDPDLTDFETLGGSGVIEVTVVTPGKPAKVPAGAR